MAIPTSTPIPLLILNIFSSNLSLEHSKVHLPKNSESKLVIVALLGEDRLIRLRLAFHCFFTKSFDFPLSQHEQ